MINGSNVVEKDQMDQLCPGGRGQMSDLWPGGNHKLRIFLSSYVAGRVPMPVSSGRSPDLLGILFRGHFAGPNTNRASMHECFSRIVG
jgi:hypothetical protein